MSEKIKIASEFDFLPKSKLKASDGNTEGRFPFVTSSQHITKYTNDADYSAGCVVFGTGGNPSIHYMSTPFSTSSDCMVISSKKNNSLQLKYLYYYLYGNIDILANGFRGAGIKHISKKYLKEIEIPLLKEEVQLALISQFDNLQIVLNKRDQATRLLDEYLLSFFMEITGDPILNRYNLPVYKIDALTVNKKTGPFGSALKKESYVSEGYKVYGQQEVVNGLNSGDYYINEEKYNDLISYKIESQDVLITLMGIVGKTAVVPNDFEEGIINPRLIKITLDQTKILPDFFSYLFESIHDKIIHSSRGITMKGLNLKIVKNTEIPLPSLKSQEEFINKKILVEQLKYKFEKSYLLLQELFKSFIYATFHNTEQQKQTNEIEILTDDDVKMEIFLSTLKSSDYQNIEQYNIEMEKLFQILEKTDIQSTKSRKGVVQIIKDKKVEVIQKKEYLNQIENETN